MQPGSSCYICSMMGPGSEYQAKGRKTLQVEKSVGIKTCTKGKHAALTVWEWMEIGGLGPWHKLLDFQVF